ncbi:alkaline phosphatase family protein [Calidifontibacter sp. DB0510]|uniref:Alkaline phosphatase family protein n=1 Tax=Metallococcus carri TaxID=1656884 RepID=A0A967B8R8_9MICO|nr:nucleotide pyrophosphatase/phosphodiesterase family protein [Metallococcus carri]NHN56891.1 alkaline phosphatase family protein [Metallococcus carri]NOP37636.1 alkaline phosphatase family protein [Calidifontibacter sp. DB2511S]
MAVLPAAPAYDDAGLAGVLPRVAGSLGVRGFDRRSPPAVDKAVVVLVDGLGLELLRARSGHAPFLRGLLADAREVTAGFPTTTATSMGTFGTGLPPGSHGLVGYQVRVPGTDRLLNELSWEDGPDPRRWQPEPTVFERVSRAGVPVTMVATDYFQGSGLTEAALRGAGTFRTAASFTDRVDLAVAALRADRRALVYLYWGDVDRTGHQFGCSSWQWGEALEVVDAGLQRLARSLPRGTSLTITADHGMVDVPFEAQVDLAHDAELADGIELAGGEMRSLQLYCRPGAVDDVAATWRARLGERAHVIPTQEAVAAGWFGPVTERVAPRLGDLLVVMDAPIGVWDSRVMPPSVSGLIGQHGAMTRAEVAVPVLSLHNA